MRTDLASGINGAHGAPYSCSSNDKPTRSSKRVAGSDPDSSISTTRKGPAMLKVVILDGSAISRNLLNTVLTNGGHEVIGDTNTSPASVARMITLRPQIVCVDAGDGNAMELLDTIRGQLPKTLVFMVSGQMDPAIIQGALQRGVHGFIVKPFNSVTVLTTIRNAVIKFARQQQVKPAVNAPAE
jgi:two-component system, chemotaxis family, chemotaxis protein CheY